MFNRLASRLFKRKVELALDTKFFYKIRSFSDGIFFINIQINADFYHGDHNPSFAFYLDILNIRLISFEIYNTLHMEHQEW